MNEGSEWTERWARCRRRACRKTRRFTSAHDVAGSGVAAAPGDWQALTFADGSIDAASTLSNVELRYGTGLTIVSSSPALDHVHFDSNGGPAISVDLSSSPRGRNLTANNNQLDGILVPPGTIAQMRLGIVGIPSWWRSTRGRKRPSASIRIRECRVAAACEPGLFVPQVARKGYRPPQLASDQPAVARFQPRL